ncbi:hypothetical protein HOD38_05265 [archaeon]|jgi:hypothetical protein|nr:hypothetical protein [archaeon]MBT4397649.1 hypothetical protein [archaeon]MBT4441655.1 hypothetical protein [archaeon]
MNLFSKHLEGYKKEGIKYLRLNVPEIQRIESLKELEDITLLKETDGGIVFVLEYDIKAPALFPHVRKKIIESGIAKRHNVLNTSVENEGTPEEIYSIVLGFYGNDLQIHLKVHK